MEKSPYRPTVGADPSIEAYRLAPFVFPNKDKQIVDLYNTAVRLAENKYVDREDRPLRGAGNNYTVLPALRVYAEKNYAPRTKREGKRIYEEVGRRMYGDGLFHTSLGEGLNRFTVGSGVDPQRGQYISIFDRWDINQMENDDAYDIAAKAKKYLSVPRDFNLTGGIGKPFYLYDRVYLDDYYGVDSRPEPGSFYGGYLPPAIIEE